MEHIHTDSKMVILFTEQRGLSLTEVLTITETEINSIASYKAKEVFNVGGIISEYIYSAYTIERL